MKTAAAKLFLLAAFGAHPAPAHPAATPTAAPAPPIVHRSVVTSTPSQPVMGTQAYSGVLEYVCMPVSAAPAHEYPIAAWAGTHPLTETTTQNATRFSSPYTQVTFFGPPVPDACFYITTTHASISVAIQMQVIETGSSAQP